MYHDLNAVFYSQTYHPIQAGSIDGTDTAPHDNAVYRAMLATSTGLYDPIGDTKAQGNPYCIVFVGRLSRDTTEATLKEVMSKYGRIKHLRLVRHIVTGASQGYAFVEYETEKEMHYAYEAAHLIKIDGNQVLVDYNRQLLMPGWVPRRLGGGLGGRKESGQLRFGGRDRPFRKPLRPIPVKELEKLGISLPGGYMQRFETPPLPKRRSSRSDAKTMVDKRSHGSPERDLKRMSSQEARHREEDDRNRLGQRQEKRLADFEEDDSKWYQRSQERRDSHKEDRYRDYARYKDNDNKRQQHNGKVYHQEESRIHLYEEEDEGYDRRPYHRDVERRDANKSHHRQEDDKKRRHGDRHNKIYYRGEEDNRRRLNESRDPREDRSGRQHHLDHYEGGDYHNEDSGRSHHHDKHGKRDSHKKEDDRRQHYEREEDGDEEDREPKDMHYSKGHKRKHRSGADRVRSDSLSSETDSRRKMQRRDGDGRFESREPSVENRWEP